MPLNRVMLILAQAAIGGAFFGLALGAMFWVAMLVMLALGVK